MKIKHQLSVATLVMAGVFATGCSQQSVMGEGASQVAGGQQVAGGEQVAGGQQVAGGAQVAGGQQVAGDTQVAGGQQMGADQQVMDKQVPPTVVPKEVAVVKHAPMVKPKQVVKQVVRHVPKPVVKQSGHYHPAVPGCTDSVRHNHKTALGNKHSHKYSCKKGVRPAAKQATKVVYKDRVVYKPVYKTVYKQAAAKPMAKPRNQWCHSHPANSLTKSVSHCHKYNQRNHSHVYGGKRAAPKPRYVAPARPYVAPAAKAPARPPVDVFALQQKLKAKGYYKGPIDGVVGSGTRAALQQFMQNR